MNEVSLYIFLFLIGTTVMNFIIALTARWNSKHKEFNFLIFYWVSLLINYAAIALLSKNPTQIGISFLFQFMPVFLAAKMLADSRGIRINLKKLGLIQFGCSALTIFLLVFSEAGFTVSLLPVVVAGCLPFIAPISNTFFTHKHESNWIEKSMAVVLVIGMVNHFNFAFFRLNESASWWGWSISIAAFQAMSIFLPLLINDRREKKEKKNIQETLEKISGHNSNVNLEIDELYTHLELQIAQKEELYHKLEASNARLREEREMNEILIRTVSHDLANPLTVINAYVEMIHAGKIPDEDKDKIWQRMKLNIQSALNMIGRIRNAILTRTQADLVAVHDVSVDRSLKKLLELFESKLLEKNITLNYNNEVSLDSFVAAEENCLTEHVFANILSNAIKFSYKDSKIDINVKENSESVMVEFRDFGKGIEEARLSKRLLASTPGTSGEQGTGFGLMVMGYFLRKFGAGYSLKSQTLGQDHGTSVQVTLKKSNLLAQPKDSSLFRDQSIYS
jgi:signal transduction histidine kinase